MCLAFDRSGGRSREPPSVAGQVQVAADRVQLHAAAYSRAIFIRILGLSKEVENWSGAMLREKLVTISAKVVSHDLQPRPGPA